jgi:hypothetical protein
MADGGEVKRAVKAALRGLQAPGAGPRARAQAAHALLQAARQEGAGAALDADAIKAVTRVVVDIAADPADNKTGAILRQVSGSRARARAVAAFSLPVMAAVSSGGARSAIIPHRRRRHPRCLT